ncbi:hypothetical protein [Moorena producens]|uniref:hypothetical protein n=1 Tax=Moorena producens TaxID=1155739 RepID=UPI00143B0BD3|nr:hypothetical protein [Moorena producens]
MRASPSLTHPTNYSVSHSYEVHSFFSLLPLASCLLPTPYSLLPIPFLPITQISKS